MMETITAIRKPEVYSYDEICFLSHVLKCSSKDNVVAKLELMAEKLVADKDRSAVFFMPKSTFDIFSVFQGDNSICEFDLDDVSVLVDGFGMYGKEFPAIIIQHLEKKISVLKDFLASGNLVVPVVSQASEFFVLE